MPTSWMRNRQVQNYALPRILELERAATSIRSYQYISFHAKKIERGFWLFTKKPKKPKRIDSHVGKHHQSFGRGAHGIIIFTIPT